MMRDEDYYNLHDENAEIREAVIHFELYRLLMNIISTKSEFSPIKYVWVHPEYITHLGSSVDLVIDAEVGNEIIHFLVIEVKRKTRSGLKPCSDDAKHQAEKYAKALQAPYYAITDGFNLLLFKNPDKEIGKYKIKLDEAMIEKFLRELAEYHVGRRDRLDLPPTQCLGDDIIEEIGKKFIKSIHEVFKELSEVKGIKVRCIPKSTYIMHYLDIHKHRGILRLGIHPNDDEKSYIHIDFDKLRKILGDKFQEYVVKLSEIPGFNWIKESASAQFTWKYIKDIATEEPNYSDVKERLKQWILEVKEIAKK